MRRAEKKRYMSQRRLSTSAKAANSSCSYVYPLQIIFSGFPRRSHRERIGRFCGWRRRAGIKLFLTECVPDSIITNNSSVIALDCYAEGGARISWMKQAGRNSRAFLQHGCGKHRFPGRTLPSCRNLRPYPVPG